jgi:serine/threonine protein kinase
MQTLTSTGLLALAAALSYLDDKAIIHRDIKLPNILLHDG